MRKYHGKELSTNDFTDGYKKKIDSMQTLYRFKGTIDTVNDLSTIEDRNIGDTYKCKENSNTYIWNGLEWINAGQDIDYSEILEQIDEYQQEGIIVSPTEPTENRRKVWMQKGKNLFDKNNASITGGYMLASNKKFECYNNDTGNKTLYIPCKPNTTYTISKIAGQRFRAGTSTSIPKDGITFSNVIDNGNGENITITSTNVDKYLSIYYYATSIDTLTEQEVLDSIQIEQGSTATSYEEYIEPKTYILNDNNVYEEFMKKEEKTILYNNSNGSNGNITLLDDAEYYHYIEIFFVDNNKHDYNSLRFIPNGENVVLSLQSGYTDSNGLHFTSRFSCFNINGKSVTSDDTRNGMTNITNNLNIKEIRSGNFIYITKIIGYKD